MSIKEKVKDKVQNVMETKTAKIGGLSQGIINTMMKGASAKQKEIADRLLLEVTNNPSKAFDVAWLENKGKEIAREIDARQAAAQVKEGEKICADCNSFIKGTCNKWSEKTDPVCNEFIPYDGR